MQAAIVLLSGGMDSTALAYWLADTVEAEHVHALSFDYSQRHRKEIEFAEATASRLGFFHDVVDLTWVGQLLEGSALTDEIEVPEGHYSAETMKATVVPNRNAIMLNIAAGVGVARGAEAIFTAVHAGDHAVYPDCRPVFIDRLNRLLRVATDGFSVEKFRVEAPFVNISKADIAKIGDAHGVPWEETWSCYVGGDIHCGRCGTCVERAEAFDIAGIPDPTDYEDPNFWREETGRVE